MKKIEICKSSSVLADDAFLGIGLKCVRVRPVDPQTNGLSLDALHCGPT